MTAYAEVGDAVHAMKLGAVDFLIKPFKKKALTEAIKNALEKNKKNIIKTLNVKSDLDGQSGFLGESAFIKNLLVWIAQVAKTDATVLILGESGTGKELVAQKIFEQSTRTKNQFVALNCAAIPENLIEAELFGYEKGSFSGASTAKAGLFEAAHGGVLFLDEIGDMPLSVQAKLLRVLQEGEVRRIGSTRSQKVDVRVLAATHQNLREMITQGKFREDLFFRLDVISIELRPLRERKEDIESLALFFIKKYSEKYQKTISGFTKEAYQALLQYTWPGNVRELSNTAERAVVLNKGSEVGLSDLPLHIQSELDLSDSSVMENMKIDGSSVSIPFGMSLKDVEELLIRKTLEATDGDKKVTAKLLGINSRTIYRKLENDES